MTATITLKNVPDDVYDHLRRAARAHHRSINSEVIACLEQALMPSREEPAAHIARARRIRAELESKRFDPDDIAGAIEQGRP